MNESPGSPVYESGEHRVGLSTLHQLWELWILIACSYTVAFPSTGPVLGTLDSQTKQPPLALCSGSSGQLPGALDPPRNSLVSELQRAYAPQSTFLFHVICSDIGSQWETFAWAIVNVRFDLA